MTIKRKIAMLLLCVFQWTGLSANENASILLYHHVSHDTPPSTTITPEKFSQHMAYLHENHKVISLDELVNNLIKRQPFPDNAVAITFDDGFRNIKENAHPILKKYGFPYTIFINPSEVGVGPSHLDWEELKQLSADGVLIANHYWDHRHLLQNARQPGWLAETRQHILDTEAAIKQHIGHSPGFLAYPFGEFNADVKGLLKELDIIGFAQHSGAAGFVSDLQEIPRYPAAGIYSNLATLKTKLKSLAMPVTSISINDPVFYQPPGLTYQMQIDTSDFNPALFSCYFNGDKIATEWQGNQVSISADKILKPGRSRVNCTAPSKTHSGRYYWHSQPWFVATAEGNWLD
ncbi:polysaccharide deacetylase family protein [Planctobacterium marinum]|uniref:polysaccharide deacetylase family protein n=1 Tax=Planctobacterium marinum TaxID=1631968 RepID=UPI001E53FC9A|nr:polysaccharide deacetylase family protein [Planctobacterium marinum]MCC2606459.1 polysaccharide deacetylase family protein [Planctobacterium marinum]